MLEGGATCKVDPGDFPESLIYKFSIYLGRGHLEVAPLIKLTMLINLIYDWLVGRVSQKNYSFIGPYERETNILR